MAQISALHSARIGIFMLGACAGAPSGDADAAADAADGATTDGALAVTAGSHRCDGARVEQLREEGWVDVGGCAVDGPDACTPGSSTEEVYHWDSGPGPSTACLPLGSNLDFAATAEDDLWIAGTAGVWRWDGTWWTETLSITTPVEAHLTIADRGRPWLVVGAQLFEYDGTAWRLAPPSEPLSDIRWYGGLAAAVGRQVFLVADVGDTLGLVHFDGSEWTRIALAAPGIPVGLATERSTLWVARVQAVTDAPDLVVLERGNADGLGAASSTLRVEVSGSVPLAIVPRALDDVWLVADDAYHWNGIAWQTTGRPGQLIVYGGEVLAIASYRNCFGGSGTEVSRWDGSAWAPLTDGVGAAITAYPGANRVWAHGTDVWIFRAPAGC